jgi:hypothetical protein
LLSDATEFTVIVQPRALDWLLESDESALSGSFLNSFDRIVCCEYDTEIDADRNAAIRRGVTFVTDTETGGTGGLSESRLSEEIDRLTYEYEFGNDDLQTLVGTYGKTYVPGVTEYVSLSEAETGLLSDGVVSACRDLSMSTLSGEFLGDVKGVATEIISCGGPEAIASTAAGVAPFGSVAALFLWAYLHPGADDLTTEELLDTLAGTGMTPVARVEIEDRLNLPPRTLEDLNWLVREGAVSDVRELCEQSPHRVEQFARELRANESRLEELSSLVNRLDREMETFAGFYSEHLRNATRDLSYLAEQLSSTESTILGPLVEVDDTSVDDIPYYERDSNVLVKSLGSGDSTSLPKQIRDKDFVVLKGAHGTGKTTAVYRAGRRLEEEGYAVRIPNLSEQSAGFVRQALERFVDADRLVLFCSYRIGTNLARVSDQQLQTLVKWVEHGVCDCVVVECRSELYTSLRGQLGDAMAKGPRIKKSLVEPIPLDDGRAAKVVEQVATHVGEPPPQDVRIRELVELADGNPVILKLATRYALDNDRSLEDISKAEELVLDDLRTIFDRSDGPRARFEELFILLSVTGGLTTREICDLLETDVSDLRERARPMSDYLSREVADALKERSTPLVSDDERERMVWRVSPDLYALIAIQRSLSPEASPDFWWVYDKLFSRTRNGAYSHHLPGIAFSLASTYQSGRIASNLELKRSCLSVINEFIEQTVTRDVDESQLLSTLLPLATEGVPFEVDPLVTNLEMVANATDHPRLAEQGLGKYTFCAIVGRLYANYFLAGKDVAPINEFNQRLITRLDERHDLQADRFLTNVYAFCVAQFASRSTPNDVEHELDEAERSIRSVAADQLPLDQVSSGLFISNLYTNAAFQLIESVNSDPARRWFSAIERRAWRTGANDVVDIAMRQFIENFYGTLLSNLAFYETEDTQTWFTHITQSLWEATTEAPLETNPSITLVRTYVQAILTIAQNSSPQEVEDLLPIVEQHLRKVARGGPHDFSAHLFLQNVYSKLLASVFEQFEAAEAERWLASIRRIILISGNNFPDDSPSIFLTDVFSEAIVRVASWSRTETGEDWIKSLEQYAWFTAVESSNVSHLDWFLEYFYSSVFVKLGKQLPPDDAERWLTTVEQHVDDFAVDLPDGVTTHWFLESTYGLAISKCTRSGEAVADGWCRTLEEHAWTVATDVLDDFSTDEFLSNVYSKAISNVAERTHSTDSEEHFTSIEEHAWTAATEAPIEKTPHVFLGSVYAMSVEKIATASKPRETEEWVDTIELGIRACANHGPHDSPAQEFLVGTYANAVEKVTPEDPLTQSSWHEYLLTRFFREMSSELHSNFYSNYHFILSQTRDDPEWLSWIVKDVLRRTGIVPKTSHSNDKSIEIAATVISEIIFRLVFDNRFSRGLDSETGALVLGPLFQLQFNDRSAFDDLTDRIEQRLQNGPPSEWLAQSFGASASDRVVTEFRKQF